MNNNYFEDVKNDSNESNSIKQDLANEETWLNDGKTSILSSIVDKSSLKQIGRKNLSRAFHKKIENYTKKRRKRVL